MKQFRLTGSGVTLNAIDYGGGGAPILFVHGGSAHAHWWDFTAPPLTRAFHPFALDQRGHGESEWAQEWAYGTQHYVDDLRAVIGSGSLGAPILVGHSMGGHNAMVYAARHSETLSGLVLVDSPPGYSRQALDYLRGFAERPPRRFASLAEARANFRLLPRETRAKPEILDHVASFTFRQDSDGSWTHKLDRRTLIREPLEVWDSLGAISCPTLIIKVTDSMVLARDAAHKMAAAVPNGRVAEIGDSFHHVLLDNPAALVKVLGEFCASIQ